MDCCKAVSPPTPADFKISGAKIKTALIPVICWNTAINVPIKTIFPVLPLNKSPMEIRLSFVCWDESIPDKSSEISSPIFLKIVYASAFFPWLNNQRGLSGKASKRHTR